MLEIKKFVVANRGEIAVRIFRTCRKMGIGTVAIYTHADRKAPHVRYADEAYCITDGPWDTSYLKKIGSYPLQRNWELQYTQVMASMLKMPILEELVMLKVLYLLGLLLNI